jgi:hypothetical protein
MKVVSIDDSAYLLIWDRTLLIYTGCFCALFQVSVLRGLAHDGTICTTACG